MSRQTGPLRHRIPQQRPTPHVEYVPLADLLTRHPGRPSRAWVSEVVQTVIGVLSLIAFVAITCMAVGEWMWSV